MQLVYDAGALIAAERRVAPMVAVHRRAMVAGPLPIVPTIILGQVWRGTARQAPLSALLNGCRVQALDEITAKQGGQLCGYAGTSDLAGAIVAVLAVRHGAGVVTSDPDDLHLLMETIGRRVPIFAV